MTAGCSLNLVCGFSYNFFSRLHAFLTYGFVPHHHQGCILSRLFRHFSQVTLNEVKPHEKQNKTKNIFSYMYLCCKSFPHSVFPLLVLIFFTDENTSSCKYAPNDALKTKCIFQTEFRCICVLSSPSIHLAPTMYV